MKFTKFGVTFKRLTEDDIELVRQKRNSPKINQFMEYREYITPEMQKAWFKSINNKDNLYFIIEYNNEKIGLINNKNNDWEAGTSESGFFIWDDKYLNTTVPIFATLFLIELGFYVLNGKKSYIRILKKNKRAKDFSESLGYTLCKNQENVENQMYVLTKESFETKGVKVMNAIKTLADADDTGRFYLEKEDYESGIAQFIEKKIAQSPVAESIKYKKLEEGRMYYYK
jgi:RimJ/RimL family protein N-acetyltransferase